MSLGHKQLEENPWDTFETIFNVDSVHEGTILSIFDKGAIIALPYGVEGFATPRHLVKEDGTTCKVDEKLQFKVLEFSKAAKRIILSHTRVWEDAKKVGGASEKKAGDKQKDRGAKPVNKISLEKTTIGDLSSELAKLKDTLEGQN